MAYRRIEPKAADIAAERNGAMDRAAIGIEDNGRAGKIVVLREPFEVLRGVRRDGAACGNPEPAFDGAAIGWTLPAQLELHWQRTIAGFGGSRRQLQLRRRSERDSDRKGANHHSPSRRRTLHRWRGCPRSYRALAAFETPGLRLFLKSRQIRV
jgi:hypothetical protein